ncbi:MAG TPA: hypothetical protein VIV60_25660 [Polyangiaceae bacterium]
MSESLITALLVGIPSVIIAFVAYLFSTRAQKLTAQTGQAGIDAAAYDRARVLYESAITQSRAEVADLREEIGRLKAELNEVRGRLAQYEHNPYWPNGNGLRKSP